MRPGRAIWAILALPLLAAAPATHPSRRPQVDTWLAQLTDRDSAVRDTARIGLMDLSASDLSLLRTWVAGHRPRPAQAAVIREVVVYVLTRDALRQLPSSGTPYIGVQHGPAFDPPELDAKGVPILPIGTVVQDVLPGAPAAREFRSGDVILGVDLPDQPPAWITNMQQLGDWVMACPRGDAITFIVRRATRVMRISITPEARPALTEAGFANTPMVLAEATLTVAANAQLDANRLFDEQWATLPGLGP